jgi:hypothetical protein
MHYEKKINSQEKENKSLQNTATTLSREVYTPKSVVNNRKTTRLVPPTAGKLYSSRSVTEPQTGSGCR